MSYFQLLSLLGPEVIVLAAALLALFADTALKQQGQLRGRGNLVGSLAGIGCAISIVWIIAFPQFGQTVQGMLATSPLTQFAKQILLGLAIFHIVISSRQKFTGHIGEYFALILLATIGMMLLVSSNNLLLLFISLELISLSLYVLAAFAKNRKTSAEAGFKYFLFGGISAAFMLFGFSFLYGLTGELDITRIGGKVSMADPLFILALVLTIAGLGFKIASAPFHLWAPDVYEGAPTPVASFVASASKVASFFLVARLFLSGLEAVGGSAGWGQYVSGWVPMIAIIAVASMVVGNLAAISQNSVKRIFAYSAIAHAGYALVALLSNDPRGLESLLYYVITYAITVSGAFAVLYILESRGQGDKLQDLAGLSKNSPLLAFSLLIFVLSLAGIPPLAGFFGKFYVFASAMKHSGNSIALVWIVSIAIAMSAVSFYYYLQILKQVYVADDTQAFSPASDSKRSTVAVLVLAALVVLLGIAPDMIVSKLSELLKLSPL